MELCDQFTADTEAFLSWLSEIGASMNPKMVLKDLRSEGRGRGVVAAADFEEDEVVFSIPRSVILNVSNSAACLKSTNSISEDAFSKMPPWLALAATIVEAHRSHAPSKWAPYLAILPRKLDSLIFWSESELAELQASAVVQKIGRDGAENIFEEHISPLGAYNVDEYHRVASLIMAYAFDVLDETAAKETEFDEGEDSLIEEDTEEEKTILSMVPLADMLNADSDHNNARLCSDNELLEMRTIKPVAKGEEILNDYGPLPRSDLLRRYGYITDNYAVYDVVEISTQSVLSHSSGGSIKLGNGIVLSPLSKQKSTDRIRLAEREGVYEDSYDIAHSGPDGPAIPDELLAFVYLFLLDEENFEAIRSSKTCLPSRSKMSTKLVGQILTALLSSRMDEYATTLEEDEQMLKNANLAYRTTMAVKVRMGEKLVLRKAIQEAAKFEGDNKRMRVLEQPMLQNGKRKAEDTLGFSKKGRIA